MSILINGVPVRHTLCGKVLGLCIPRYELECGEECTDRQDVQAMSGDPGCFLQIHAVKSDGIVPACAGTTVQDRVHW